MLHVNKTKHSVTKVLAMQRMEFAGLINHFSKHNLIVWLTIVLYISSDV